MVADDSTDLIVKAIKDARVVRLVYQRQADEVVSMHNVAPLDVRHGWSPRTAKIMYLWAWCFAEDRLEMHLMDRILRVTLLDERFDPAGVLSRWPADGWPRPENWEIARNWD